MSSIPFDIPFDDATERKLKLEAERSCFSKEGYEYQPIMPWVNELKYRMEEAVAKRTNLADLSYAHPRGFFPNKIRQRKEIRELLRQAQSAGWLFNVMPGPQVVFPNLFFLPAGWPTTVLADGSLEWCDTTPFELEIEKRFREGKVTHGWRHANLTGFHPRGEISPIILHRIRRRQDPKWRSEMREHISVLVAQANKDEAFAQTQEDRSVAIASKNEGTGDPTALLRSAEELRARSTEARRQVAAFRAELRE